MHRSVGFLCNFSTLDDLPKRSHKDRLAVLKALSTVRRFSIFEATSTMALAKTLAQLGFEGLYKTIGGEYPWIEIEITEAGQRLIAESEPGN